MLAVTALLVVGCGQKKTAEEFINSSKHFVENNNSPAAILELKNAIRISPKNARYRYLLGDIYIEQGSYNLAKKELERARDLSLDEAQLPIKLARVYFNLREEKLLNSLLTDNYNNLLEDSRVVINVYLGVLAFQNDSVNKAQDFIDIAKDISEESIYSKYGAAWLTSQENIEESLVIVNQILNENKSFSEALLLKGHLFKAQKKFSQAINIYQEYIEKHPLEHQVSFFKVASLIEAKQFLEAENEVDKLLVLFPRHPVSNELKAIIRFNDGDFESAEKHARNAIQAGPDRTLAALIGGVSSYRLNNIEQAYQYLIKINAQLKNNSLGKKIFTATRIKLGYLNELSDEFMENENWSDVDIELLTITSRAIAKSGDKEKAKELLDRADINKTSSVNALTQVGLLKLSLSDSNDLKELTKAAELNEESPESKIILAVSLISKNQLNEAQRLLTTWLVEHPEEADFQVALAEILIRKGELAKAEIALTSIIKESPNNISAKFRLSQLKLGQNNFVAALQLLKDILDINNRHIGSLTSLVRLSSTKALGIQGYLHGLWQEHKFVELSSALANSYVAIKEHDKAVSFLQQIDNQESSRHYVLIGDIYLDKQDIVHAESAYRTAVEKNNKDIHAITRYALSLDMQKKYQQALTVVESGLANVHINLALELLEVNYLLFTNQAKSAGLKFTANNIQLRTQPKVYNRLAGQIALAQHKYSLAVTHLDALVQLEYNKENVKMLAIAHAGGNDIDSAISVLKSFLIENKNRNDDIRADLAQLYLSSNFESAIEQYLLLVAKYPQNALFHNNLSYAAARVNNMALANKHIVLALQLAPENTQVLDTYGYIFYVQKKYAKALVYLEKANKKAPRDIGIARNLANCLIKLNRKEEADSLLAVLKL